MTRQDSYGNALSTDSTSATEAYDRGLHLFLGAEYGAVEAFGRAVEADPGFALGHAALARARMMGGGMPGARDAVAHAADLASRPGGADDRERAHIAALDHAIHGRPAEARALVRTHVRDHPRDALAAQLCASVFGLIGFSGEVGREAELLAYTSALLPHYGDDWWMMSMHAISLCETGRVGASQDLMERALELNPRNANAAHFKSHAQYEAGEAEAGRAYLDEWLTGYDARGVLHGHLSWHSALWALHAGDAQALWATVAAHVAPGTGHGLPINVLTDTAAILYRAEIAGLTVDPAHWAALSDYAAQYFPDTGQSFADIHAALAHAMAGDGARLARIAETARGFAGDLVRPVARGWMAMARGDWAAAIDELTPVMAATERLGGSRAQRDLLELAWVNALLKLGRNEEARRSLATRRPILAPKAPVAGYT
ncbi:hypothetical protein SAMN05444007_102300 [Cribrihabitans marinus]|uniref:Tetratricopeptide repeat protein 38 n=1 Tax=Cribrihabitans marinus TaxID=1227549 RepID=A0A1H6TEE2_9RHOB|nr:tetratricopeptide repeat protein [Cribrihabitans marinus]GGH22155.1 tetratricopeptide repeat protein 38 family protein [Cribrihabitans marinus]SEI76544.1 hypothetical protein SAMN05444007_102300 [Cribrihabitans marinus]